MTLPWTLLDPPNTPPAPLPVRGIPYLAASAHSGFPQSVPHAAKSILRVTPNNVCESAQQAGELARQIIDTYFDEHPVILFKGFPLYTRQNFSHFMTGTNLAIHDYKGGNALRDKSTDKVSIVSTEHRDVVLSPHNENAYMPEPPNKFFFACLNAADEGGEIPINDERKTPGLLPAEFIREMRARDLRYIRRLARENSKFEIGWETSFGTSNKREIERYLQQQDITYQWQDNGSLEFWFTTPVFKQYRGEDIWFNQLSECNADFWLWHPEFDEMGITRETCQSDTAYGDGEAFSTQITTMVRAAIWRTTEVIKLEPTDILLLDNHLIQHGRMAYRGNRQHLAALVIN